MTASNALGDRRQAASVGDGGAFGLLSIVNNAILVGAFRFDVAIHGQLAAYISLENCDGTVS